MFGPVYGFKVAYMNTYIKWILKVCEVRLQLRTGN